MKTKGILLIALFVVAFTSAYAAENIKGMGNLTTQKVDITEFDDVEITGPVEFNYTQSEDPTSLEVTIDENLFSFVKITTKDRKLVVALIKGVTIEPTKYVIKANSKWLNKIKITNTGGFYANSPLKGGQLEARSTGTGLIQLKDEVAIGGLTLISSGGGNIVAPNVASDLLECKLSSTGSINVKGKTAKADYSTTGSGEINAFDCPSPEVVCKVTGSGTIKANCTDNMKANIIGSGNIFYKGNTNVTQKVIGTGKVEVAK